MTDSGSMESGTPLAPVNVDDLKRVWQLIQRVLADCPPSLQGGGVGIDLRVISRQCEPGADVNAVFFRATLLRSLFQAGLLDDWREGNEPTDSVFRLGAVFVMEQGVQGFDPASFIERLRSAEP